MTFKHLKFAESSTMQAFEKLAKAKGLVKPEAVTKTAAKTLDLNPSENLLENILKLAQGLRAQGFSKHANDLENKFLIYKKAESLYETSKETGEDLVDQAHPKGSHKMNGQDHTVLTIVDQKKKIEEVVNKTPKGKLSTAQDVIDAVKKVLGTSFLVKTAAPTSDQVAVYNLVLDQTADFINQLLQKMLQGQKDNHLSWTVADAEIENKVKRLGQIRDLLKGKLKEEAAQGDVSGIIVVINNLRDFWLNKDEIKVWDDEHKEVNGMATGMIDTVIKKLQEVTWSIQHPDFTPSTKGFDASFKKTQWAWQQKELLPDEKPTKATPNTIITATAPEVRSALTWYASEIQKNVLSKEEEIYKPIPDNDKDKISIMDQAFDRAENFMKQLNGLSESIKGTMYEGKEQLTAQELNASNNKFSMFKGKSFSSKDELVDYLNKIKSSVYNAIGIK